MLINQNNSNDDFFSYQNCPKEYAHRIFMNDQKIPTVASKQILIAFGEYWISILSNQPDGSILRAIQKKISDFIFHLPHFQNWAELFKPNIASSEFKIPQNDENRFQNIYHSKKEIFATILKKLFSIITKQQENQTTVRSISTKKVVIQNFLK